MISTLGSHCGNSRSLNRFSTSRLFSHEATFFVAKIFDNGKYKKHSKKETRSSHLETAIQRCSVIKVFSETLQNSQTHTCAHTHMCQSFFFNKVAVLCLAKGFLVLVCNKTHYHLAFLALKVIRIELGVSLKIMLDFDKLLSSFE